MNKIIGLTGPTGAGKSIASALCSKYGLKHIDCDILARQAVIKGSDGLIALTKAFGESILNADGTLNRKALASAAFKEKEKTELLNKTIFPYIKELVFKEIKNGNALLDAPTLFESGLNGICFKTIAVLSDTPLRLNRIMERDGITEAEALQRINAGKTYGFYRENADYIIYNNKTAEEFLKDFEEVLKNITENGENL